MAWRLPRLRGTDTITEGGKASLLFSRWWQSLITQIEDALNNLSDAVDALNGVQGSINGFQPHDARLDAIVALDDTRGILEQTGADTYSKRLVGTGTSISIATVGDNDARYLRQDGTLAASASTTTHKLAVDINGTTYHILLSNV